MSLKAVVKNINEVPEQLRDYYQKIETKGGNEEKYLLTVEAVDGYSLEDVSALKSSFGKERTAREKLEKELQKFNDVDPIKAREALQKVKELAELDPVKEADKLANAKFEAVKTQLLEKHTAEKNALADQNAQLQQVISGLLIDSEAKSALSEAKGSIELLLPHVKSHTRVKQNDGKFVVEVFDADGNARIADAKGSPMTIRDLVTEMKQSDTFARAFEGSGQTGTGKEKNSFVSGSYRPQGNLSGSQEDRLAAIRAQFPDLQ